MEQYEIAGQCAFCQNSTHDFPDDSWHEQKHNAGWHGCEVFGGFRFRKPECQNFKVADGVITSLG